MLLTARLLNWFAKSDFVTTNSKSALLAAGAMLICLLSGPVSFAWSNCPFCPPSQPTFSEYLSTSDIALLAQWKGTQADTELQTATTTLSVVDLLKGDREVWKRGTDLSLPFARDGQPGDLFLLMGKKSASPDQKMVEWSLVQEINESLYAYIRKAPDIERMNTDRLIFFLDYLEAPDPEVANDAFAEFSRATFNDVSAIRSHFRQEKLRQWLESPDVLPVRKGLYALMLGLNGKPQDADWFATEIFRPVRPDETRLGVDGMMGAYVLLTGKKGLDQICQAKLDDPKSPSSEAYATVNLLRFLWEERPFEITVDDLRKKMRNALVRKDLSEVAIVDLARWKDWDVWTIFRENEAQAPFNTASFQQKMISFAKALLKDSDFQNEKIREDAGKFLKEHPAPASLLLPLPVPAPSK